MEIRKDNDASFNLLSFFALLYQIDRRNRQEKITPK